MDLEITESETSQGGFELHIRLTLDKGEEQRWHHHNLANSAGNNPLYTKRFDLFGTPSASTYTMNDALRGQSLFVPKADKETAKKAIVDSLRQTKRFIDSLAPPNPPKTSNYRI